MCVCVPGRHLLYTPTIVIANVKYTDRHRGGKRIRERSAAEETAPDVVWDSVVVAVVISLRPGVRHVVYISQFT